jgi:hypothetical protein
MKTTLLVSALVAVLISYAAAQDFSAPKASFDPGPALASNLSGPPQSVPGPPSFCRPCLFYAGDFDSNASDANGLANEKDIIVSTGAAVYTPFIVPKGKTWIVTGLFTNNFLSAETLDPRTIPYEVRVGIPKAGGNGGKLVCHGTKSASLKLVEQGYGYRIFATKVENIKGCRLAAGKYWMSVVPYCTNANDGECTNGYRAYLSNDDGAMARRFGPLEPANDSFFNSLFFGANWEPSSNGTRYSVGAEGTSK